MRVCLFMCEGTRENERVICQLHNNMVLGTVNIIMTVLQFAFTLSKQNYMTEDTLLLPLFLSLCLFFTTAGQILTYWQIHTVNQIR